MDFTITLRNSHEIKLEVLVLSNHKKREISKNNIRKGV